MSSMVLNNYLKTVDIFITGLFIFMPRVVSTQIFPYVSVIFDNHDFFNKLSLISRTVIQVMAFFVHLMHIYKSYFIFVNRNQV